MKKLASLSFVLSLLFVAAEVQAQSVCVTTGEYDTYLTTLSGQRISINSLQPSTQYWLVCDGPSYDDADGTSQNPNINVAYLLIAGFGITPNTLTGPVGISDTRADTGVAKRIITTDPVLPDGLPIIIVAPTDCSGNAAGVAFQNSPD